MWVGIFDQSALMALGKGNWRLSWFVVRAQNDPAYHVFAPALCLTAASAARRGLGEHVLQLPGLQIADLGCADAVAAGDLIADGIEWQTAQAIVSARPNAEWPSGRPILTSRPELYKRRGVRTIAF